MPTTRGATTTSSGPGSPQVRGSRRISPGRCKTTASMVDGMELPLDRHRWATGRRPVGRGRVPLVVVKSIPSPARGGGRQAAPRDFPEDRPAEKRLDLLGPDRIVDVLQKEGQSDAGHQA